MSKIPLSSRKALLSKAEQKRLFALTLYEEEARKQGYYLIAGIDEAGRGPLAGPVAAAVCLIPAGIFFCGIDDSKKLTPDQRNILFEQIVARQEVAYAVSMVSAEEIDQINIYQATIRAMLQAIELLAPVPDLILVDGMKLLHVSIPCRKIVGGDAKSQSIAAASVLAKVTRDRLMEEFDSQWPEYGFKQHKGYATPQHLKALEDHGPCPIHRKSFEPIKSTYNTLVMCT